MSSNEIDVGTPPANLERWETFKFRLNDFKNLPSTKGTDVVESSKFTCSGVQWRLKIYPGGHADSSDGMVSVYLYRGPGDAISIRYSIRVKASYGKDITIRHNPVARKFDSTDTSRGWSDFERRSVLLDNLEHGTLHLEVSMTAPDLTPSLHFKPQNPFPSAGIKILSDESSADIMFVVDGRGVTEEKTNANSTPSNFHAHRLILKECAPTLADLCESSEKVAVVNISDVDPEVFHFLLHYSYGGTVPADDLKANSKAIIDAADKYGVINLKLEAEASYVQSTIITMDNVMDNLHFADKKNCALLKEAAVDFLVENRSDVLEKVSLKDVPGSLAADILTAVTREKPTGDTDGGSNKNSFSTMRVATLRKLLHEKGLEVDGSREFMIAELKKHS